MTEHQPNSRDAELALLACIWQQPRLAASLDLQAADFYGTDTEALYLAITNLHNEGVTPDPIVILRRTPKHQRDNVNQLLIQHIIGTPAVPSNAPTYAAEIRDLADRRNILAATDRIRQIVNNPDATPDAINEALSQLTQAKPARQTDTDWRRGLTPGGAFIFDTTTDTTPLWGTGGQSLWAPGEALIIAGPQGTGKTTLAQQVGLGRLGLPEYSEVLELPITPGDGHLLYLAMDRPSQARRSFRRMVGEASRDELDNRLTVWPGPPPQDLGQHPDLLTQMCREAKADTCIVDSLKDAFLGLTDDEAAAAWNRARQTALRDGIQLIELHHNRKTQQGVKADQPTISDVYGSTWITSGAGSVLLLNGAPGDPIVKVHHLKQPAEEVGPLSIVHDHDAGRTTIWHGVDLVSIARITGRLTAREAAGLLYDTENPTSAEKEKARRRLDKLAEQGLLVVLDPGGRGGDRGAQQPRTWGAAARPNPNHAPITRLPAQEPITQPRANHEPDNNPAPARGNENTDPITPITRLGQTRSGGSLVPPSVADNPETGPLHTCKTCGKPVDPGYTQCHKCAQTEALAYYSRHNKENQ